METITIKGNVYRIKKMNMIELLAMRHSISFDTVQDLLNSYNSLLERIELNVKNDTWIQVKQGDNFYPANIENDMEAIEQLITFALTYIKSVFQQSNSSNNQQE